MVAKKLGTYLPSQWDCPTINREMRALPFIPACCTKVALEIRWAGMARPATADQWHRDKQTPEITHFVMWASETPTEILADDWTRMVFLPYDVIWVRNAITQWPLPLHRMPPEADCMTRWFTCFRCHFDLERSLDGG